MLTSMSAFFKETTYTALKQIGLDRFSIMGVSMGGVVGQMIALKYPDALEIIEKLHFDCYIYEDGYHGVYDEAPDYRQRIKEFLDR